VHGKNRSRWRAASRSAYWGSAAFLIVLDWWGDSDGDPEVALYRDKDADTYELGRFGNHPAVYVSWFDAVALCRGGVNPDNRGSSIGFRVMYVARLGH
jgi:hypothetical protein